MQSLLLLAPLAAFLVAYLASGLYTATAVLMVVMVGVLLIDYVRERRIPPMHGLSAVLYLGLGGATLLLHDKRFLELKPTIFLWALGLAFLGSFWVGRKTLTERLLAPALEEQVAAVTEDTWRLLNGLWVAFYGLLGALNLLVANYASERMWVWFKVLGLTGLTVIFVFAQVLWLMRRGELTVKVSP
jgi:intracellular septation protein